MEGIPRGTVKEKTRHLIPTNQHYSQMIVNAFEERNPDGMSISMSCMLVKYSAKITQTM
jgi:hypothetical protein